MLDPVSNYCCHCHPSSSISRSKLHTSSFHIISNQCNQAITQHIENSKWRISVQQIVSRKFFFLELCSKKEYSLHLVWCEFEALPICLQYIKRFRESFVWDIWSYFSGKWFVFYFYACLVVTTGSSISHQHSDK